MCMSGGAKQDEPDATELCSELRVQATQVARELVPVGRLDAAIEAVPRLQFVADDRAVGPLEQEVYAASRRRVLAGVESPIGTEPVIIEVRPDAASD
jgi:hypothetical protein